MRSRIASASCLRLSKIASVSVLALGAAACSGETSRFAQNPFSNPFASSSIGSNIDRETTGSISNKAAGTIATAKALNSSPLPAPSRPGLSSTINPPGSGVNAAVTGFNANGWTAAGGSSVVLAQGESVNTLANRYGVPADAIYKTNGLTPGSQVPAGSRITVPVYRPGEAGTAARTAAPEAPRVATVAPPPKPAVPAKPVIESKPIAQPKPVATPKPLAEAKPVQKPKVQAAKVADDDDEDDTPVKKPVAAAKPKVADKQKVAEKPAPTIKAKETPKPVAAKPAPSKTQKVATAKPVAADEDDEDETPAAKKPQEMKATQPKKPQVLGEKPAKPTEPKVAAAPVKNTEDEAPKAKQQVVSAKPAEKSEPVTTGSVDAAAKPSSSADFRWPAKGRVISGFRAGGNDGINIAVPEGTPVKAAEDGTVAYSGSELKGYGNLVLIRHSNGYVSAYAHNGELKVKKGDTVKRGQTVATSGQTGNVSSPQLHFELRKGSTPVDPSSYLN
ncbi:MAG: peptidoglycan DD-metalloendopeptidase family protein [Beijerinckiaceae bacterium]